MSLKYTTGEAGTLVYQGESRKVWGYNSEQDLLNEFEQLGGYLGNSNIAWVGHKKLILQDKVVGMSDEMGRNIIWFTTGIKLSSYMGEKEKSLWDEAVRTDWEEIMVETSW